MWPYFGCIEIWVPKVLALWDRQEIHWYFFSTLAQASLGFVALLAVVTVFRLQVNHSLLADIFRDAWAWLNEQKSYTFSKEQIKKGLTDYSNYNDARGSKAKGYCELITDRECFPDNFVLTASQVMKQWGCLFAGSLLMLFLPNWNKHFLFKFLSLAGMVTLGICTWRALLSTRRFMQVCLNKKAFVE